MKAKTENLVFGHLNNKIVIYDRNRVENGDYTVVAQISYHRSIEYFTALTDSARREIEDFANAGNMAVSACKPDEYALCLLN